MVTMEMERKEYQTEVPWHSGDIMDFGVRQTQV